MATATTDRRFRLDASWTRPRRGAVAFGGSPLTMFRLTPAGVHVANALEDGETLPTGHEQLTDRLLETGALHPDVTQWATPSEPVDVAVVIPAHDEDLGILAALVAEIGRSPHVIEIVIVDDASAAPIDHVEGARIVRLPMNAGPARARNVGAAATSAPAILFVDADVTFGGEEAATEVVDILCRHLGDGRVGLVAPRVVARHRDDVLAHFEAVRSPLDLGEQPARVRPLTRVSYVPAAVALVRRTAFDQLGGFDESMRFGEDVDLVWRLDEAAWRCRYESAVTARHEVRRSIGDWLRQRRNYGTSAAPLAHRHPTSVAPVHMSRWSFAAWLGGFVVHPLLGLLIGGGTTTVFARRLTDVPDRAAVALQWAGRGHLHAGRLLARAVTRVWWPLALPAALISRRARRAVIIAVVAPALVQWCMKRPDVDPVRFVALSLADDLAYGTGVWTGCMRERDVRALVPSFTR